MSLLFAAALAALSSNGIVLENLSIEDRYPAEIKIWRSGRASTGSSPKVRAGSAWSGCTGSRTAPTAIGSAKGSDVRHHERTAEAGHRDPRRRGEVSFALEPGADGRHRQQRQRNKSACAAR